MRGRDGAGGVFERIGSVLDGVLQDLHLEERFASADATERWRDTVGPEIARRTRCEGVRDGELLVLVRGTVWKAELTVRRMELLQRINEGLAEPARLRAIRFQLMRGKEDPGRDSTR
jgi:predicted nucleic acid-binding Zn ribbon protein